jgi:hypothetical protein
MANIYSGTVTLGAKGTATVRLPAYFEALNGDFRYQLTALGAAAPNLHVAKEIAGNRFRVAGGQAGQKVSWQVTGIRRDAYARANRMQVVRPKVGKLRGRYVSPELHGKPETAGLGPTRLPRQRGLRIGRPEHKQLPELD